MVVFKGNSLKSIYEQEVDATLTIEEAVIICAALGFSSEDSIVDELSKDHFYGSDLSKEIPGNSDNYGLFQDFLSMLKSIGVVTK